jgi:hypothetical protein
VNQTTPTALEQFNAEAANWYRVHGPDAIEQCATMATIERRRAALVSAENAALRAENAALNADLKRAQARILELERAARAAVAVPAVPPLESNETTGSA